MPYETPIPPVPDRQQELAYINKLEQSFMAQPWHKLYMNEALREKKLEDVERLNYVKKNWWINFCFGALITGVIIFPLGRFYHRFTSGVPHYFRPKMYYVDFDTYLQGRNTKSLILQLPTWAAFSTLYAYYFTDFTPVDDEYFKNVKVKEMF
jgi:hypothetical protein